MCTSHARFSRLSLSISRPLSISLSHSLSRRIERLRKNILPARPDLLTGREIFALFNRESHRFARHANLHRVKYVALKVFADYPAVDLRTTPKRHLRLLSVPLDFPYYSTTLLAR